MAQKKNKGKSAAKATKGGAAKKGAPKAAAKPTKGGKKGKAGKPAKAAKPAKTKKASPIPKGFSTLSAHLIVDGATKAIEFYTKAFGAKLKGKMDMPDGRIGHAELQIGDSRVMLADDFPDWNGGVPRAASKYPATSVTLHMYVKNADKVFAQAIAAGCTVVMPLMDAFWGDRYGKLRDPFGHDWSIATHQKDMTPKQMQKAMMQAMSDPACAPPAEPEAAAPSEAAPALEIDVG